MWQTHTIILGQYLGRFVGKVMALSRTQVNKNRGRIESVRGWQARAV
jgi:Tfp pilus assembly protein PilP